MAFWKEFLRRTGYLGRREQFDDELDQEIQFHIETRAEEFEREGIPRPDALERARREFGPRARIGEDTRDAWQFRWIEDFWRDLSYAARAFAKSPGFTAVAVLSLAVGVGANCAMFSIADAVLLSPLPVPHASEVVVVASTAKESNASTLSYPDYQDVKDASRSFRSLAGFMTQNAGVAARPGALPHMRDGKLVTSNYFDTVQVKPQVGRVFLPEEDRVAGKDAVVILSYTCWEQDFGSDPAILGKTARLNGGVFTIVGVMPSNFTDVDEDLSDAHPAFYLPVSMGAQIGADADLLQNRTSRKLTVIGRLKAGVAAAQAKVEVDAIAANLQRQYPEADRDRRLRVQTVLQFRGPGGGVLSLIIMILASLVLLVACANVAGLLTSRAPARAREMAMRLAIGAGRPRLIRQMLTENLLLAVAGGILGLGVGYLPILLAKQIQLPGDTGPQSIPVEFNGRVLLFSTAVALLSVVLFGLVPAFRSTRTDLISAMKGSGEVAPRGHFLKNLLKGRNLLVVGQVALSMVLLTVSSVLYKSVDRSILSALRNPGFRVDHLIGADFDLAVMHLKGPRAEEFFKELSERMRRTEGVSASALATQDIVAIRPAGSGNKEAADRQDVRTSTVWTDDGFFDTLQIPIVKGREFLRADVGHAPEVAVVNEVLARHYWPGQEAVGNRLRLATGQWVEIVGVAHLDDFMAFGVAPMDIVFLPYEKLPMRRPVRVYVRSASDPLALAEPMRRVVHDLDPDQVDPNPNTLASFIGPVEKAVRLGTGTIGSMGLLGLALALVGLYGLIAYDVNTRTREFGIRMALGARPGSIVNLVLRLGIVLALLGTSLGLGLNASVVQLLAAFLGQGSSPSNSTAPPPAPAPNDGNQISLQAGDQDIPYVALGIAVLAVTILAAYLPARRASRVDPTVALRGE